MKTLINMYRLLPERIKKSIRSQMADAMEKDESRGFHPANQFFLDEKHLKNCRFVKNRKAMLALLPKNATVAEIGVFKGEYAAEILNATDPARLYLIDSWENEFRDLKKGVEDMFSEQIGKGTVKIIQDSSINALNSFEDEYFDWVYLDSDHSYSYTLKELEVLGKKVKRDGIICGDDYSLGVWYVWNAFGVIQAVNEFCVKNSYELIYFAFAPSMFNSFAIRKL